MESADKSTEGMEDVISQVDVCFVIDCTGSMSILIHAAKARAREEAEKIAASGALDMRYAVVAYRDHPPQEHSYVTQVYPFSIADDFQKALNSLSAVGGGDRDEAVYDGLIEAGKLDWRPNADKLCFLIGDSPPHNPCLCHATPGGVVEILGGQGIKLNAISIAGSSDTTAAFTELTDALRGKTEEVAPTFDATSSSFSVHGSVGSTLSGTSTLVSHSRTVYRAASMARGHGMSVSLDSLATATGLTPEMVEGTVAYMADRGISIDLGSTSSSGSHPTSETDGGEKAGDS